jgi:hypothetical protein
MCTLGHRSNTSSDSAISPSALSLSTIITDTDCYRKQRWKRRQTESFLAQLRWSTSTPSTGLPSRSAENEWMTMNRHDSQTTTTENEAHINYMYCVCTYVRLILVYICVDNSWQFTHTHTHTHT